MIKATLFHALCAGKVIKVVKQSGFTTLGLEHMENSLYYEIKGNGWNKGSLSSTSVSPERLKEIALAEIRAEHKRAKIHVLKDLIG